MTLLFMVLSLSGKTLSQNGTLIMTKYREHIEEYIMKGYGLGWKHCDIVSDDFEPYMLEETPTFVTNIESLKSFDILTTFSSSHCLLISAHVRNNQSLSDLIQFGWSVIQQKRLALLLKLSSGLTLDMATNKTKLPFMVAASMKGGKEQSLCPIIGKAEPRLMGTICDKTYTSYKNKSLQFQVYSN